MAVRRRESAGRPLFLKRHLNVKYMCEQLVDDQNYAQMYHSYKSGRSKKGEWGIGNRESGMGNGEWGVGSGEWEIGSRKLGNICYSLFPTTHSPFTLSTALNPQQNNPQSFPRRRPRG